MEQPAAGQDVTPAFALHDHNLATPMIVVPAMYLTIPTSEPPDRTLMINCVALLASPCSHLGFVGCIAAELFEYQQQQHHRRRAKHVEQPGAGTDGSCFALLYHNIS